MNSVELELTSLADSATRQKKIAQAMSNFIKSGKAKRFIEISVALRGETISSYSSVYQDSLWIHIHVNNLEGMKDPRLGGILTTFEYMNPTQPVQTQDYPGLFEREFKYCWVFKDEDGPALRVYVIINARIKEDSESCKREVIGYTDGKPEPIYKLVCVDQEEINKLINQ